MAARTTIPKKQMRKKPIPPPPSFSTSDEGSPPPSISPLKKISAGPTAAVLRKHSEPSSDAAGGEKEEDRKPSEDSGNADPKRNDRATRRVTRNADDANDLLKKPSAATKTLARTASMDEKPKVNDKSSKSEKEESTDEESSEDSWNAPRQPNPPEQPRDSQTAKDGKQVANTSSSSDSGSGDGDEDGKVLNSRAELIQPLNSFNPFADPSKSVDGEEGEDEGSETEGEEESTADSESSEDFGNTATKENPPPQPLDSQNMDEDKKPSNTSSSSGSGNDEKDIETRSSGRSLEPLSNKPIDSSAQPVQKEPRAQISKKKRTAAIVGAEGDHEKERFKRIWSNEDELALLQGILEYKERHHVIPYAQLHAEPLLKSVKDSLSFTVSVHQINDKVRRMKKRYDNTATRQFFAKKSKISDPHNAAVFDLSKKIWEPLKEESILLENKLPLEKKEENVNNTKIKELKHFAGEYPSLYWFLRSEHANNALLLQNQIPRGNTNKLEEKCKKLEMIDIQLNMQKIEFLSSAVKLIKDALDKC